MIYIIGVGGVGSWLAPSMRKLVSGTIVVADGDTLEKKNLDRQLFSPSEIGQNKAIATCRKYQDMSAMDKYYTVGCVDHVPSDCLMVGVDNDPARIHALMACDMFGCSAIIGANETHSAEAYVYFPAWRGTPRDPRIMYPEMVTSTANDPTRRQAGCTGEYQEENRQLSSANFMAAAMMQHLFVLWMMEYPKMEKSVEQHLPNKVFSTLSRMGCLIISYAESPRASGDTSAGNAEGSPGKQDS